MRAGDEAVSFDADAARARTFLGAVLPLLEPIVRARPELAQKVEGLRGTVQIESRGEGAAARICFGPTGLRVEQGRTDDSDVACVFSDERALARFFAGKMTLPSLSLVRDLSAARALARARLVAGAVQLLKQLELLEPPPPRVRARMTREDRALRVELVLTLVTRALCELHRAGWPPMRELADDSPERVFQWTCGDSIAAFLRIDRGEVQAGNGVYAAREPFVRFAFPDVDAAFDVLMATESSMKGFRGGRVETYGSPEYARKMGLLMQKVDAFLKPS